MKLWIVSNCRPNSGFGTYVSNLHQAVGDKAKFVNLFGPVEGNNCPGEKALISDNSKVRSLIARSIPRVYFNDLIKTINSERKNGLIVHYAYNLLPLIGDMKRDIITIHDIIFMSRLYKGESNIKRLYSKQLLKGYLGYKNIITVSEFVKQQLLSLCPSKEIEVIHSPCSQEFRYLKSTNSDRIKLSLPSGKILILSDGNNKPWKNLTMVSRVMKKLGDKFFLVRVGPSIGSGMSFNSVTAQTLNLLYNVCDILLYPSYEEGFGFPIIEAMKTGLPAVVSDIEVFHEIGNDAVEYVNPYDENSIIRGIYRALDGADRLRELGFKRSVLFSQEIFKEKMLNFYNKVYNKLSQEY